MRSAAMGGTAGWARLQEGEEHEEHRRRAEERRAAVTAEVQQDEAEDQLARHRASDMPSLAAMAAYLAPGGKAAQYFSSAVSKFMTAERAREQGGAAQPAGPGSPRLARRALRPVSDPGRREDVASVQASDAAIVAQMTEAREKLEADEKQEEDLMRRAKSVMGVRKQVAAAAARAAGQSPVKRGLLPLPRGRISSRQHLHMFRRHRQYAAHGGKHSFHHAAEEFQERFHNMTDDHNHIAHRRQPYVYVHKNFAAHPDDEPASQARDKEEPEEEEVREEPDEKKEPEEEEEQKETEEQVKDEDEVAEEEPHKEENVAEEEGVKELDDAKAAREKQEEAKALQEAEESFRTQDADDAQADKAKEKQEDEAKALQEAEEAFRTQDTDDAQADEGHEEKALQEAEESFRTQDTDDAQADEEHEEKALQEAEESFPEESSFSSAVHKFHERFQSFSDQKEELKHAHTDSEHNGVPAKATDKKEEEEAGEEGGIVIVMTLKLGMKADEFDGEVQDKVVAALGNAAGVRPEQVKIPWHGAPPPDEDDGVLDKRTDFHVDMNHSQVHQAALDLQQQYIADFEGSDAVGAGELQPHEEGADDDATDGDEHPDNGRRRLLSAAPSGGASSRSRVTRRVQSMHASHRAMLLPRARARVSLAADDEFIDTDGDGLMDFKEFCEMPAMGGHSYDELRKAFDSIDVNGDGDIDQEEFDKWLKSQKASGGWFAPGEVEVDVEVTAKNNKEAEGIAAALTADNINAEFAKAGLPAAEIVSAARVTSEVDATEASKARDSPRDSVPRRNEAHADEHGADKGDSNDGVSNNGDSNNGDSSHPPASSSPAPAPDAPSSHPKGGSTADQKHPGKDAVQAGTPAAPIYPIWPHHEAVEPRRDPTKLEKSGVNVDGAGGVFRAMPLPIFDESQWNHVQGGALDAATDADERIDRDTGLGVLRKAGVVVDAVPMENEHDEKGWLPQNTHKYGKYVHTLLGMQTRLPYFADASDANHEAKSRQALVKAGVDVGPVSWDGQDHQVEG